MFVIAGLIVLFLGLELAKMEVEVCGSIVLIMAGIAIALIGIGLIVHPFYNLSWVITFLGKY